jgi:pyruvate kinase
MATFQAVDAIGINVYQVDTVQAYPFGMRVKAKDTATSSALGDAEFIYVKGVASGAVGLACVITAPQSGTTALTAARVKGKLGVMVSLLDAATKFGWVQVEGVAEVQVAGTVVSGATAYLTATSGKLDDAVVAGDIVYGGTFATADGTPTTNWARVALSNAHCLDTDNA